MNTSVMDEEKILQKLQSARNALFKEIKKSIVGQEDVLELMLIAMFCKGHCVLVGVPGLAKTLMVKSLASLFHLDFNRIQFTPDLMPSDITGTEVLEEDTATHKREFKFIKGPVFTNILLADEINRTPPKTQSALLQAMQEYHVTYGGKTFPISLPFFVLATQNPIEQEGTYPLPEAQLDRFLFEIHVPYPQEKDEVEIVKMTTSSYGAQLSAVLTAEEIMQLQEMVRRVPVAEKVVHYAVSLVRATRPQENLNGAGPDVPEFVKKYVSWGAGPRASQALVLSAKARALLHGKTHASVDDVRQMLLPSLRHRLVLNFQAEAEGMQKDALLKKLVETVREQ